MKDDSECSRKRARIRTFKRNSVAGVSPCESDNVARLMREEKLNEVKKERTNEQDKVRGRRRRRQKKGREKGKRRSETDEPPATMSLY